MSIIKVQCIDCIRCMFLPVIFKVQSFQWVKLLLSLLAKVKCHTAIFFISFYGFLYILFIQYNSVICRPSDHTLWGGPGLRFEPGPGGPEAGTTTPQFVFYLASNFPVSSLQARKSPGSKRIPEKTICQPNDCLQVQ